MKRGPKTKLKLAKTDPHVDASRAGRSAATRQTGCPFAMGDLALCEWKRYAPILTKLGVLNEGNAPAFASYCAAFEVYCLARLEMGVCVALTTDSGGMKANPAASILLKSLDSMLKFLREFGMTPASLRRLGETDKAPPVDKLAEFLRNA